MKVLLFGATGMVGQGILRECLNAPDVELVQTIVRATTGRQHPKLREIVHPDLYNFGALEPKLAGFDACFFSLGVSSAGITEQAYTRLTHDLTLSIAETLAKLNQLSPNPGMTFVYVSGQGTDSSENGRFMWARVKGRTENALLRLPFRAAFMFRPGIIEPMEGIRSKTTAYRIFYGALKPLLTPLRRIFPNYLLSTEEIGIAMLQVARQGAPKPVLESSDIRTILNSMQAAGKF